MMRGDGRLPAVHMDVGSLHATSCRFEGVDNTPMEEREAQIAELKAKRVKLEQWRERLAKETLKEDLAAVKEEHSDSSPRHHISPAMAAARESVRDLHLPGHDGDELPTAEMMVALSEDIARLRELVDADPPPGKFDLNGVLHHISTPTINNNEK